MRAANGLLEIPGYVQKLLEIANGIRREKEKYVASYDYLSRISLSFICTHYASIDPAPSLKYNSSVVRAEIILLPVLCLFTIIEAMLLCGKMCEKNAQRSGRSHLHLCEQRFLCFVGTNVIKHIETYGVSEAAATKSFAAV